jgi:tetratricopeptide (TPR) repeat protein
MRKDLEGWLRGDKNRRSAASAAVRRKPVLPSGADEWNLPVVIFPGLPVVLKKDPSSDAKPETHQTHQKTAERKTGYEPSFETLETAKIVELISKIVELGSANEIGVKEADIEDVKIAGVKIEDAKEEDAKEAGVSESVVAAEAIAAEETGGAQEAEPVRSAEFPENAAPFPAEEPGEALTESAGSEENAAAVSYNGRSRNERRFEDRLRRIELARQTTARYANAGFRQKYRHFITAGIAVFVVASTFLLTYSYLQRNSYASLMKNAKALYDQGQYEESLRAYREVSLIYPDRVDPFLGVAFVSEQTGRVDDAIEAYKSVLDLEPYFDFAQNELMRVMVGPNRIDDGGLLAGGGADAQKYEHAMQMGEIALLEGSYGNAFRYFSDALALRSDDANVWVNLADALVGVGSDDEAVESLNTALIKDPSNEKAKSKLADIGETIEKTVEKPEEKKTS